MAPFRKKKKGDKEQTTTGTEGDRAEPTGPEALADESAKSEEEKVLDGYFQEGSSAETSEPAAVTAEPAPTETPSPDDEQSSEEDAPTDEASGDDDMGDLMSIFESEEAVDEDLATLTQGLEAVDAESLLTQARQIAAKFRKDA